MWSVTSVVWRSSDTPPIIDSLLRTVVVPLVTVWPGTIACSIAVLMPPISHIIEAARRPDGWHYMFAADEGSPLGITLIFGSLIGIVVAMLAGLILSVFFVLPWEAWVNPRRAIEGNMLDASTPEAVAANTGAMRMFATLIMLVFAVPTMILWGKSEAYAGSVRQAFANVPKFFQDPDIFWGDMMWVVGVLLIPIGVILMLLVRAKQRPNTELRAATGTAAPLDVAAGSDTDRTAKRVAQEHKKNSRSPQ